MLEIEERERGVQVEEQKALEKMRRNELTDHVLELLKKLEESGQLPETVDGEVVQEALTP